jgi:hypothetical protein
MHLCSKLMSLLHHNEDDKETLTFLVLFGISLCGSGAQELISNEKAAKVDNYKPVIDFLHFVLVRDPILRPTLDDVMACLAQLQAKLQEDSCIEELVCDIFEQLAETQGPSQNNNFMPETTPFINKSQDKKQVTFPEPEISKPGFSLRLCLSWNWYCCMCCWRRNKHTR